MGQSDTSTKPSSPTVVQGDRLVAYAVDMEENAREIFTMDIDTLQETQLTHNGALNQSPQIGHDDQITFVSNVAPDGKDMEIYRMRADGSNLKRVTQDAATNGSPSLGRSGAGDRIVWSGLNWSLYTTKADGTDPKLLVGNDGKQNGAPSWCPDGTIVYMASAEIRRIDPNGANKATLSFPPGGPLTHGVDCCTDSQGASWIVTTRSGNVAAMKVDGNGYIELAAGSEGDFSRDCRYLTYLAPDADGYSQVFLGEFDGQSLTGTRQLTHTQNGKTGPSLK